MIRTNKTTTVTTSGIELDVELRVMMDGVKVTFIDGNNTISHYNLKTLLIDWMDDTQLSLSGLCLEGSSNDYDISKINMNILRAHFINLLLSGELTNV